MCPGSIALSQGRLDLSQSGGKLPGRPWAVSPRVIEGLPQDRSRSAVLYCRSWASIYNSKYRKKV